MKPTQAGDMWISSQEGTSEDLQAMAEVEVTWTTSRTTLLRKSRIEVWNLGPTWVPKLAQIQEKLVRYLSFKPEPLISDELEKGKGVQLRFMPHTRVTSSGQGQNCRPFSTDLSTSFSSLSEISYLWKEVPKTSLTLGLYSS